MEEGEDKLPSSFKSKNASNQPHLGRDHLFVHRGATIAVTQPSPLDALPWYEGSVAVRDPAVAHRRPCEGSGS